MSDSGDFYKEALTQLRERLAKLPQITIPSEPIPEVKDPKAALEQSAIANKAYDDIERSRRRAETQNIVEGNLDRRINRKLRFRYARWVFCNLVSYSVFVGLLLLLSGGTTWFVLPPSVLDFLVGSTAAAAIGLVYAVTSGLFGPASK